MKILIDKRNGREANALVVLFEVLRILMMCIDEGGMLLAQTVMKLAQTKRANSPAILLKSITCHCNSERKIVGFYISYINKEWFYTFQALL